MTRRGCATCGRRDVRLYRVGGEFLRPVRVRCNAHLFGEPLIWIPYREDVDGSVWGHTSRPETMGVWLALPDADPAGPSWKGNRLEVRS